MQEAARFPAHLTGWYTPFDARALSMGQRYPRLVCRRGADDHPEVIASNIDRRTAHAIRALPLLVQAIRAEAAADVLGHDEGADAREFQRMSGLARDLREQALRAIYEDNPANLRFELSPAVDAAMARYDDVLGDPMEEIACEDCDGGRTDDGFECIECEGRGRIVREREVA